MHANTQIIRATFIKIGQQPTTKVTGLVVDDPVGAWASSSVNPTRLQRILEKLPATCWKREALDRYVNLNIRSILLRNHLVVVVLMGIVTDDLGETNVLLDYQAKADLAPPDLALLTALATLVAA